ncbi:MAG: DUF2802 domain-containing protein [Kangiellaceae bacterium]|nr:DUF2802 domain-containing protein [Kangiellaceae bacterium]
MSDWFNLLTTSVPWFGIAVLFTAVTLLLFIRTLRSKIASQQKHIERLQNEFRAMNSGHLGMGREIKKVIKEIANAETTRQNQAVTATDEKTYDQAGLLLSRGATIEEVVESCSITPAEAELIAIMRHSAPAHKAKATH